MFWGSHSGLNKRTSKAVEELTVTAPQAPHRRALGTVILGPAKAYKTHAMTSSSFFFFGTN